MLMFEVWVGLGLALIFFACIASYLLGCWRTEARCWREQLQRRTTQSQPLPVTPVTTGMLRKMEGDVKKYVQMVGSSARWKGEKRERESGDLH